MHSRDLEVTALSIQTRSLVEEANRLLTSLKRHQRDLNHLIEDVREDLSDGVIEHEATKAFMRSFEDKPGTAGGRGTPGTTAPRRSGDE